MMKLMKEKMNIIRQNKYFSFFMTFILFVIVLTMWIFLPSFSNTTTSSVWDGSISSEFAGGDGSEENPYLISSGSDLAYLKQLLESEESSTYNNKSYKLAKNINLGENEFSINNIKAFSGIINGDAYTISNGIIVNSLFLSVEEATIKNINFQNTVVINSEDNISALLSSLSRNSRYENITVSMTQKVIVDNFVGALIGIDEGSQLKNIVIDTEYEVDSDLTDKVGTILYEGYYTSLVNILIKENNILNNYFINEYYMEISSVYNYTIMNDEIVIENNDIKEILNNFIDSEEYEFKINNNRIVFAKIIVYVLPNITPVPRVLPNVFSNPSQFDEQKSGITADTVYINDLEADWNYYYGLNYVSSSNGTIPTGENQNLYNETNLVAVQVNYSATDPIGNLTGTVSLTEAQSKFVYYKYYPVENGKVKIELIDNPFTNRPTDKGFNNWVSNGVGTISFDSTVYKRYIEIDVEYENNKPKDIILSLHASWVDATVVEKTNSTSTSSNTYGTWVYAFNNLNSKGITEFKIENQIIWDPYDMTGYFYRNQVSNNTYVTGYDEYGVYQENYRLGGCGNSCYYYSKIENEDFVEDNTYYYLPTYGTMQLLNNDSLDRTFIVINDYLNQSMAGYYIHALTVARNSSGGAGYYDSNGEYQTSNTTCSTTAGCPYYKLIQSNDADSVKIYNYNNTYYYMVTRDTNIIYLSSSLTSSSFSTGYIWGSSQNKPFTLTSVHNGVDYRNTNNASWNVTTYVNIYNDTTLENLRIISSTSNSTSDVTSSTSTASYIYGRYNNLKIGRGITRNSTSNKNFNGLVAGGATTFGATPSTSSQTCSTVGKYNTIIESGFFNTITLTNLESNSSNICVNMNAIYGNDYDRVSNNNSNLDVHFVASGSWGGNIYSTNNTTSAINLTVKSGSFGTSKFNNTTGIYVGGRGGGTHSCARSAKIEGGWIYNLIGGPLSASNRAAINDIYIYQSGGEIEMITGGAGTSATYGNRIISLTGGKVNYSVFGGSNSYTGTTSDGTLIGSSFIYAGGNVQIGDSTLPSNSTMWGAEAGSIFGVGNGRSGTNYTNLGSCAHSNVIIDGEANILRNVYGGGNYGAAGLVGSDSSATTNITILNGTIQGNVYGGGNQNGFGTSSKVANSSININMMGGTIEGNIYGGSNVTGTIQGKTNLNIKSGQIDQNIYGGGKGGTSSVNFVARDVNVTIGSSDIGPTINGSVYGGSAFGSVNGTGNSTSPTSYPTTVTMNNGTVKGSLFGGGEGNSSYRPYVMGNITVTVNKGTIQGDIYGGNNNTGYASGTVDLTILSGEVTGNVYGGGKGDSTYVGRDVTVNIGSSSQSPTINGSIYGGSAYGTVNGTSSNTTATSYPTTVNISNGLIKGNVFGGGEGSSSYTPYVKGNVTVNVNGGNINSVYGGNDQSGVPSGTVKVELSNGTIGNAYGGGNKSSVTNTDITLQGATITENLFGGSNQTGDVTNSKVTVTSGTINGNIYGGNNAGGNVTTTTVYLSGGTIHNAIYGGGYGNGTRTENTNIEITGTASIATVYGGGYSALTNGTATISINGGTITKAIYGGGYSASTGTSYLNLNKLNNTIPNVYGGGESASVTNVNIKQAGINVGNLFGGSNTSGVVQTSKIDFNSGTATNVLGGGNKAGAITATINLKGGTINEVYGGANEASATTTNIILGCTTTSECLGTTINNNLFGGSNKSGDVTNSNITVYNGTVKENIFGGNNAGGKVTNSSVLINGGTTKNVFGGGNNAITTQTNVTITNGTIETLYGGGNEAAVIKSTDIILSGGTVSKNVYGGGNYGTVNEDTSVYVTDATIGGSLYAGGNGATAIVGGNTNVSVGGTTTIGNENSVAPLFGSVFGGGNNAATGESDNSIATVNIAGGKIYGNVYGGANTSVVNGTTDVNIGIDTISNKNLKKGDIYIRGTIFGGGETNALGGDYFDWDTISVTKGINIDINGNGYNSFKTEGSIFGSGNASSSGGQSSITIKNYGTISNPQKNISIQRTNILTIDNSAIVLSGASDRANEYSEVPFALSRVGVDASGNVTGGLKLKNHSTLFLETGANLLAKLESFASDGSYETANLDDTTNHNRIYMYEGKNLNIATKQDVSAPGEVYGMTFFGMFTYNSNGTVNMGIYSPDYQNGDPLDWGIMPIKGSYVLGVHKANHDIEADGFYSHFMDEETGTNQVSIVEPTPPDSNLYRWVIGEDIIEYEIDLVASKYATLGTAELNFLEFSDPNTTFQIIGFDDSELATGISLVDANNIPRIAATPDIANSVLGLSVKSGNKGWLTNGETKFLTDSPNIKGTTEYIGENSTDMPSLVFYLYHSKNLSEDAALGTVRISIMAITKIDDLTSKTERIVVNVNLSTIVYQTNEYEGSMIAGREYSMFSSSVTNITSKSSLSAYYALHVEDEKIYKDGFHRALVSSYVLPLNTKITMIDFVNEKPVYYYYVITESDVSNAQREYAIHGEASYNLSLFYQMGSINSSSAYDDAAMNDQYYSDQTKITGEEFIFIVNFEDTEIKKDITNATLYIELRDKDAHTIISVLGIQRENLLYNIFYNKDAKIDVNATIDNNNLYIGHQTKLSINTTLINSKNGANPVYDTSFFDSKLGVKITLFDNKGNVVSGTNLLGVTFILDNKIYYPSLDGSIRIKVADRVGNVALRITMDTSNSTLATGSYTIHIESFASPDGIYYGNTSSDMVEIPIYIINDIYGLNSTIDESSVILDAKTGFNKEGTNIVSNTINFSSGLTNPNIRIELLRRKYDSIYNTEYELVNIEDYVSSIMNQENKISTTLTAKYLLIKGLAENDYHLDDGTYELGLLMKSGLTTGTYRLDYNLYDKDVYIGKISRYIIIK